MCLEDGRLICADLTATFGVESVLWSGLVNALDCILGRGNEGGCLGSSNGEQIAGDERGVRDEFPDFGVGENE